MGLILVEEFIQTRTENNDKKPNPIPVARILPKFGASLLPPFLYNYILKSDLVFLFLMKYFTRQALLFSTPILTNVPCGYLTGFEYALHPEPSRLS